MRKISGPASEGLDLTTRSISPRASVVADQIYKEYRRGGHRIVAARNVSFSVDRGQCLAVVGESGSGKSTVAKILVGLEHADGGSAWVEGRRIRGQVSRLELKRRAEDIQMVFQDPGGSLNRALPVRASIEEVISAHSSLGRLQVRERAEDLFRDVGLDPSYLDSKPSALSGGQKQRVAIARALAANPKVIVLDEAVSALDVTVQKQVLELLARLRDEHGLTYLFISHDLSVVSMIADSVIVMRKGEVVESGSTQEVLGNPQHPYTRLLLECAPRPGWHPERGVIEKFRKLES